jgi:hypothetical protein
MKGAGERQAAFGLFYDRANMLVGERALSNAPRRAFPRDDGDAFSSSN